MAVADRTKDDYVLTSATTFEDRDVANVSGEYIITETENAIKASCIDHARKYRERFFNASNGRMDRKAFSDYLLKNLTERDADQNMIEGLRMKNGDIKTKVLSAMSNTNWV